jgi:dihydroxy-acid dehydratase
VGEPDAGAHPERGAFRNAVIVAMAMGCSTNAVIHLIAMARRAGQSI